MGIWFQTRVRLYFYTLTQTPNAAMLPNFIEHTDPQWQKWHSDSEIIVIFQCLVFIMCVCGVHIEVLSLSLGLPCQSFYCSMSAMFFFSFFISCFYICSRVQVFTGDLCVDLQSREGHFCLYVSMCPTSFYN